MKMHWTESNIEIESNKIIYSHTPSFVARTAFFYVQTVGHFYCGKDYYTRREGYRSYLLIYTMKGKGCFKYREKQYEVRENQVFLMDCYDFQEYYSGSEEQWVIKWLHFNGGTSSEYYNTIYENYGPLISMNSDNSIHGYIDTIMELLRSKDIQFEIKASSIIVQILTDIILAASVKPGAYKDGSQNSQVEAAMEFIEKNYSSNILLEDIARAACCSVYHFARIFKRHTGYSPYEYLLKYRINKAKTLLKTTGSTVENIAGEVGFGSTSSFIKTFRDLEEMTPLKYRKFWAG